MAPCNPHSHTHKYSICNTSLNALLIHRYANGCDAMFQKCWSSRRCGMLWLGYSAVLSFWAVGITGVLNPTLQITLRI